MFDIILPSRPATYVRLSPPPFSSSVPIGGLGSFWDLSGTSPSPPIVTALLNRGRRSRRSNNVKHRSRRSNKVEHIVH